MIVCMEGVHHVARFLKNDFQEVALNPLKLHGYYQESMVGMIIWLFSDQWLELLACKLFGNWENL